MSKDLLINYKIIATFLIYLYYACSAGKDKSCYQSEFLKTSWTDRRPHFIVNMTFSSNGAISSFNSVNMDVQSPVVAFCLTQKDGDNQPMTLFNVTTKLCEFIKFMKKIPDFKAISKVSLKQSNYTFSCPMRRGVYVMENMHFNNRNPLLSYLYKPKRTFSVKGGLFEELPNKTLSPLSTYIMVMKIVRKSCVEMGDGAK